MAVKNLPTLTDVGLKTLRTSRRPIADFRMKPRGIHFALRGGMANREFSPDRSRTKALQQRSFEQTCNVIAAYPKMRPLDDPSRDTWRQLVRAVNSSTFNLEEADAASSDADFLAKMRIALREAKEAHVAIRIIVCCKLAGHAEVGGYLDEADQRVAIFFTIVKNKAATIEAARS